VSLLVYPGNSPSSADRVVEKKDRRTLSERQEGKKVRSLAESMLFYVGIPAVLLYPLGVLGLGIQLWREPLFPYSRLDTVWIAVSLVPEKSGDMDGHQTLVLRPDLHSFWHRGIRVDGAGPHPSWQRTCGGLRRR
jgi:hypothetical protein